MLHSSLRGSEKLNDALKNLSIDFRGMRSNVSVILHRGQLFKIEPSIVWAVDSSYVSR